MRQRHCGRRLGIRLRLSTLRQIGRLHPRGGLPLWRLDCSHAGLHSATVLGKKGTYENNHKNLTCTALNPNAR